jgi:hypothetical protein
MLTITITAILTNRDPRRCTNPTLLDHFSSQTSATSSDIRQVPSGHMRDDYHSSTFIPTMNMHFLGPEPNFSLHTSSNMKLQLPPLHATDIVIHLYTLAILAGWFYLLMRLSARVLGLIVLW